MHDIIFYSDCQPEEHAGGPKGYLGSLKKSFELQGWEFPLVVSKDCKTPWLLKALCMPIFPRSLRAKIRNLLYAFFWGSHAATVGYVRREGKKVLANPSLKYVIVNDIINFERVSKFLQRRNPHVKIALMSHTPETMEKEFQSLFKARGVPPKEAARRLEIIRRAEENAFRTSTSWIFPTYESMEPCKMNFPWFDSLAKVKQMYFVATGCDDLRKRATLSKSELFRKYRLNPDAKFRICYIGRHNYAKGYDVLIAAARLVLERTNNSNDVEFVIGGTLGSITPPNWNEWKECGRVNPADLLSISDVFILPNDSTYFDLILLEALSFGIPVIASKTGGNISVAKTTKGLILFNRGSYEDLASKIKAFSCMPKEAQNAMGVENRNSFLKNYTLEAFATRYKELINHLRSVIDKRDEKERFPAGTTCE